VESGPVVALVAVSVEVVVDDAGNVLFPVSARVGRPGPGSEFTRVSLRPQPLPAAAMAAKASAAPMDCPRAFIARREKLHAGLGATHDSAAARLATEAGLRLLDRGPRLLAAAAELLRGIIDFVALR
jgi:hypothetical protein